MEDKQEKPAKVEKPKYPKTKTVNHRGNNVKVKVNGPTYTSTKDLGTAFVVLPAERGMGEKGTFKKYPSILSRMDMHEEYVPELEVDLLDTKGRKVTVEMLRDCCEELARRNRTVCHWDDRPRSSLQKDLEKQLTDANDKAMAVEEENKNLLSQNSELQKQLEKMKAKLGQR